MSIKFLCVTLPHMSIGSRVVLTVTFQKVDNAPDTKTCAQGHYESLQNTNCAVEKFHKIILLKNVFDFGLSCCVNLVHIEGVRGFYHGTLLLHVIPDMSHEERQLLDDAMICTYGVKGITHDNASLEQPKHPGRYKEMPILGDLYEILAASPETKRLANILNRLVNGSARSFNQQTNVALDNKYIVLDISELTGDLLTVGMFVALDFVWDKAKENRTAEKAIFVDECWQLIGASSNRQAAESVLELAKTIRGYGGSLVCATQDLNDFFALDDGKYGKGIINNSKTKILLNLEEEEAQRVQGVLHLSEAELMEITHFERGSALISTNNNNIAVEIKCSQMEKELITTDRRELAELAQRAAPKQHPC